MSLYSEIDMEEYYDSIAKYLLKKKGSAKFPTNEDLKTALKDKDLYSAQPKNRNYMFELLENHNNREYVNTNNEDITIEHIFPQNPHADWNKTLGTEEIFQFKEKYLNTIGNLTLSGNNGALGNKSFVEKKAMNNDGKEQGYIFSNLWLNTYLKTLDTWNTEAYEKRMEMMYERFLKIWEFPDVIIVENDDSEEQNIFDSERPTNKKLEYFIFENTKIEEDTVAQMYFYIIKSLYEKNSQLLVDQQEFFKMTRNSSDFRAPQEIINGWFIESNIDSNSKFIQLKRLLTLFELEDELFIKFSSDNEDKAEPNRYNLRKRYWTQLLPLLENTTLFSNVKPTKDHWISCGAGTAGVAFTLVIAKYYVRIELTILTASKETNKEYYRKLFKNKTTIETTFGNELEWEELSDNKMSRVKYEKRDVNINNESDWEGMNTFLIKNLPNFERAFSPFIKNLK